MARSFVPRRTGPMWDLHRCWIGIACFAFLAFSSKSRLNKSLWIMWFWKAKVWFHLLTKMRFLGHWSWPSHQQAERFPVKEQSKRCYTKLRASVEQVLIQGPRTQTTLWDLSRRQNQRSPIIGGLCMPINRNLAGFTSPIPISPTVGRCNFFSIVAFLTTPRPVALLTTARPQYRGR
jgi:hypothetical protein